MKLCASADARANVATDKIFSVELVFSSSASQRDSELEVWRKFPSREHEIVLFPLKTIVILIRSM